MYKQDWYLDYFLIIEILKANADSLYACMTISKPLQSEPLSQQSSSKIHIMTRPLNRPFWCFPAPLLHRRLPEHASSSLHPREHLEQLQAVLCSHQLPSRHSPKKCL